MYQGEVCILNGSVIQPDLFNGAQVKTESGVSLGEIYRVFRKSLQLKIAKKLLVAEDANLIIEFLADMVVSIEESNGQMVVVIPDGRIMVELERFNGQLKQSSNTHVWATIQMFEQPFVTQQMGLFRKKKAEYQERLKTGRRRFREYHLG